MIPEIVTHIALTVVVYFVAAWWEEDYSIIEWNILTLIIACGIVWNVWDPS